MYTEVFDVFDKKQVQIPTKDRELRIIISITGTFYYFVGAAILKCAK